MINNVINKFDEIYNNEPRRETIKQCAPLLIKSIEFFLEKNTISCASIQRKFEIGYSRAALMIDFLEKIGCISEMNTETNKRTFLITKEEFERDLKDKLQQI